MGVFDAAGEERLSNDLKSANQSSAGNLLPVMAMIDPACTAAVSKTYRAATTGDYDLFAVFPPRAGYDRGGADQRVVPGTDRFKVPLQKYIENEDHHRGNLTPRIARIRGLINSGVRGTGYEGGDVVHHSDEAGRPMISSIVPGEQPYCVRNTPEFKMFIGALMMRFVMTFNAGWHRELGISVSNQGSYEV